MCKRCKTIAAPKNTKKMYMWIIESEHFAVKTITIALVTFCHHTL